MTTAPAVYDVVGGNRGEGLPPVQGTVVRALDIGGAGGQSLQGVTYTGTDLQVPTSYASFRKPDSSIVVHNPPHLDYSSFSFCAWLRPTNMRTAVSERYFLQYGSASQSNQLLHVGWRDRDTVTFSFFANDLSATDTAFSQEAWHHW